MKDHFPRPGKAFTAHGAIGQKIVFAFLKPSRDALTRKVRVGHNLEASVTAAARSFATEDKLFIGLSNNL